MNPPDDRDIVIRLDSLGHRFGENRVLHDLNLSIERGQVVAVVGPSGCGKSTLLRAILGTHPPKAGSVLMDGHAVTRPGFDRGIVYQRYSLYPFMTARDNVAFGLMLRQTSIPFRVFKWNAWRKIRAKHREEAEALLVKVGLAAAIHKYPTEMSGGMCQRVAIAQALIMRPKLLLLDEPFGALDEATREELQRMVLTLYQENTRAREAGEPPPHTILLVTHELNEALYVCDRVLGLSQYWDYNAAGHTACPGATIVYDRAAPTFEPHTPREFEVFVAQRDEIRDIVFEPENPPDPATHRDYWTAGATT
jgi:NitT/TauT family transport system ATP-binding protein